MEVPNFFQVPKQVPRQQCQNIPKQVPQQQVGRAGKLLVMIY